MFGKDQLRYFYRHTDLCLRTCSSLARIAAGNPFRRFHPPRISNGNCLVLGNGPSLSEFLKNASELQVGKDVFCVNFFGQSDAFASVRPSRYVLADPSFWLDDVAESMRIAREEFVTVILPRVDWQIHLLLPNRARGSWLIGALKKGRNENIAVHFYNPSPVDGFTSFRKVCYKHNLGMVQPYNVLIAAIFLAINSGYKKIYVYGADHNIHENLHLAPDNKVYVKQPHFYDSEEVKLVPFTKPGQKETFRMSELFRGWGEVYRGYELLEEYSRAVGCRIFNASSSSSVDAFERLTLNQRISQEGLRGSGK